MVAPDLLQRVALGVMAFLTLMSFTLANVQALLWVNSDWLVSTVLPSVIVELTNDERQDDAETPLTRNSVLDAAAGMKAAHMAKGSYFAHYSPDGVSPWYWFDEAGYTFVHAGENLAVLFTDSEDVVEAWMDSPGHRANILNGTYTEIGVGTAEGTYKGKDTVFVVQLFGTPAETAPEEIASNVPLLGPVGQEETFSPEGNVADESIQIDQSELPTVAAAQAHEQVLPPVIVSDMASMSRDGMAADSEAGFLGRVATQPQTWLESVYAVLAVFVSGLLMVSIVLAFRKKQTMHLVYGTGLLCLMAFLLAIHSIVTGGAVIL